MTTPGECGTVLEVRGDRALLSAAPNAACGSCMAKEGCLMSGEGKERRLWVKNTLGAKEGDTVEFIIGSGAVIKTSLLFYFLPIVLLTAGIASGIVLHRALGMEKEAAGTVFGLVGLVVSFLMIRFVSGIWQGKRSFEAVMVRITESRAK